jgi:hypothetical protein
MLLSIGMIVANQRCISEFQKPPKNVNWDPSQHEVVEFVRKCPGWLYITADWGIATHLICGAKKGTRVQETWWKFNSIKSAREILCSNKEKLYIVGHHDAFIEMKDTKPAAREMLTSPGKFNLKKVYDEKIDIIHEIKNKE